MGVYSHTRLETFRQCPRRFYYRYIARAPLEDCPDQIATFLGKRVHETLEFLYRESRHGNPLPLADVLGQYRQTWKENWSANVVMPAGSKPADHRLVGERCLRDYYARHQPFDQIRTVALERRITFPLDESGRHHICGFVDRLACSSDGTWQIHDYKTNARLPTQQEKDLDPQLAYYELGIRRMWKSVKRVELVWHFLRFDQTIVSARSTEQLTELRANTLETIVDIEHRDRVEEAFPTNESRLCDYCEYEAICPVRKHLVQVRALPPNRFLRESGVKLVNRWAKLKAEQDELDAQKNELQATIDEIKEALNLLAQRGGLSVVVGSDKEVTVTQADRVVFPRKTVETEQAEELETKLRKSRWWVQLSTLDRNALTRAWEQPGKVAAGLRKLLANYVRIEQETTLRLRNRRD